MRRAQQGSANGQSQTAGADARELASQAMLTISSVSLGRRLRLIMNKNLLKVTLAGWVATVAACGQTEGDKVRCQRALQSPSAGSHQASQSVTVAFIGDQGSGRNARSVLRLIKAEGADLVLHQGDFDYGNDPDGWDSFITEILGADFPYFAAVGNHDTKRWFGPNGYQAKLQKRLSRISGVRCIGELGVRSACHYRGLFFILSGAGTISSFATNWPQPRSYGGFALGTKTKTQCRLVQKRVMLAGLHTKSAAEVVPSWQLGMSTPIHAHI